MVEPLDRALLNERRLVMADAFAELLAAYLEDSARLMAEIADALERADLDRLRRAAHELRGSSANVGAATLAELCSELESASVFGADDGLPALVERVRCELRDVRDAVIAEQHKLAS